MSTILRVENLTKNFGSGTSAVKALNGVSFTVEKGEFVAVMGSSGSGKSTLLNVIATIEPRTSGDIYIDETPVGAMREREIAAFRRDKLGFIFQEYNLLDTLTVGENVVLPLNLKKTDVKLTEQKLAEVAATLGITDQLNKFPYELSGGQRQRAACARAVINEPALVLADEPTGALDSRNSRSLMELFTVMNTQMGSTILMVTHDAEMAAYATRVLFLRDGKIYSEIVRGALGSKEFYNLIIKAAAESGGENAV